MSSTDTQNTGQSPLQSELGTTTIQDSVVTAIIGMPSEEVDGVTTSYGGVKLPGDTSPTVGEFVDNLTGGTSRTRGLSVDEGERQTTADITVNVVYGRSIPQLAQAVRERVIERVENLTGLEVTKVNIQVNDVTCLKASSQLVSISARRPAGDSQHFSRVVCLARGAGETPRDVPARRGEAPNGRS